MGFYNSHLKRLKWTKEEVVRRANLFATEVLFLDSPPALQAQTVRVLQLSGEMWWRASVPVLPWLGKGRANSRSVLRVEPGQVEAVVEAAKCNPDHTVDK